MKQRSFLMLLLVGLLSVVLAACAGGSDKDSNDSSDKSDESTDKKAIEGGDLVIAVLSDAQSLDPAGSNDSPSSVVQANIYETLVTRNDDNELEPGLAESWEAVDELTWEFKLREGVKFHDGTDFNAEAVKANLERILNPDVASPRLFL